MNRFKKLNGRVVNWANDKEILKKGNPLAQHSKTEEEVAELREALFAQNNVLVEFKNSKGRYVDTYNEIEDAIGDILVTILIQCKMQKLDPLDCLESGLDIIEKRTGRIINNTFVKDAN